MRRACAIPPATWGTGNLHRGTPSVIFCSFRARSTLTWHMTYLSDSRTYWRSPRVQFADITPAVLRLPDGSRQRCNLETISLTGGLLSVSTILDRGSRIKLMFLAHTGTVLGAAEMLNPVSMTKQPFRFIALEEGDQRRLRAVVQSFLDPGEQAWIEKYRAALVHRKPARRGVFRVIFESLTLLILLGSVIYLLNVHLLQ